MQACLKLDDLLNFTACLHIASVIQQRDLKQWLAECSVDMDKVRGTSPLNHCLLKNWELCQTKFRYIFCIILFRDKLMKMMFGQNYLNYIVYTVLKKKFCKKKNYNNGTKKWWTCTKIFVAMWIFPWCYH